jgi:methylase of polypeptide subunit release factors
LLGLSVDRVAASAALSPLTVDDTVGHGLFEAAGSDVRAALDLRPYSEIGGIDWWVFSDLGSDVRPGPVSSDNVVGIGAAATTLAQATMRRPVATALDIGTGRGVQALNLSRHASHVTATDISARALRMAATTAALNEQNWDLRQGSLLQSVLGERFDLIVCNPPFIVGPGFTADNGGLSYRDSGWAGDDVSRRLVCDLPAHLNPGGTAQLLANWAISADESWQDRVGGWLEGSGCDAWIWQREVAEPGEYVRLWLRDAGEQPGTDSWKQRYDAWLDWFAAAGVLAVGMGLVSVKSTESKRPSGVCEDVPQPIEHVAVHAACAVIAALLELPATEVQTALLPVIKDLVQRGFLIPANGDDSG